ncbi:MAG: FHA domain-containing protein [Myxococcota bacterium]
MAEPACLEVVAAARHTGVEEGLRVPLTASPFDIGRQAAHWTLRSYLVSRQHARLARRDDGRWTAEDLSSTNGTLVAGKYPRTAAVLASGDLVDLGAAIVRFLEGPPEALPTHPGLEEAIAVDPRADEPWRVWADWLLEQDHPLGAWLTGVERPPASALPWLGPLARWQLHRRLQSRWHRWGLLTSLRLPCVASEEAVHTAWALRHLPLVPAARFLAHLEVEVLPQQLDARPPQEVLLEALQSAALPASLRTITFTGLEPDGPPTRAQRALMRPPPRSLLEETYLVVRRACPRLESGARALIAWDDRAQR